MHPSQIPIDDLLTACDIRRQRRSGPGGQHRNKVETGIFITHVPTKIDASATEKRSQELNRRQAVFRLRIRLAIEHRSATLYEPTELWQCRCHSGRVAINSEHDDYPAILAEAMDNLGWNGWDVSPAAMALDCTASQLVKLLRLEPAAFLHVNRTRIDLGLRGLR